MPMGMPLLCRRLHVPADSLSQSRTYNGGGHARTCRSARVIGLVGAEMASVPGVGGIAGSSGRAGGRLSPSSLKADCISPQLAGCARPQW